VVPVSSIILAAILLNEKIQLSHLLGMSLIICGILIATQKPPTSPSKMTTPEHKIPSRLKISKATDPADIGQ
jgi:drug/metabolite transporter (DMT)-like permease